MYDLFRKQSEIAEKAYSIDRDKKHEIACIYDEESTLMVAPKTSHDTIEYMRNYEVTRIGAGMDMYFHNDMANPDKETRFHVDNMSDLTGIRMEMDDKVRVPSFAITGQHPVVAELDKGHNYGDLDRPIKHSVVHIADWEIGNYERSYLCLCFYSVDEEAQVHASSTGKKTIKLPKCCNPFEVYEEKQYGSDTDVITCDMLLGETKMFYVGG